MESIYAIQMEFQSTPPAEARGDARLSKERDAAQEFQSTPPAEARGDSLKWSGSGYFRSFNPLPPPKRRPRRDACHWRINRGFNPLPPPKRGETIGLELISMAL